MTLSRMMKDETLLIFLFITLVDFANSLYLSQSSVTTEPGKSLAISCRDTAGQPVTWKGPKGTLSATTKPKIQDTSIGKLLVFNPTRFQDTGNYTCSLISNKNEFRVFALVVEDDTDTTIDIETSTIGHPYTRPHHGRTREKYPTEEPFNFKDTPETQRGKEGENVTIRCEINNSNYKINWLPDANEEELGARYIPIGDGLLVVNVSRKEDNRIFICEALKSKTGQVKHKRITFIVEHKPEPVTYPVDLETGESPDWVKDEVYGFLDENVNLTCEVESEPPPRFQWKSNKQAQKKIGRIITEGSQKSILQLKMSPETVDKYQCIATNKYGRLEKIFNLQIGTRPNPPEKIDLVNSESHNIELKIKVPEDDEEAIKTGMDPRWINVFYRNVNSEDWDEQIFNISSETFILTELNSSTKYEIMAAVRNVAGLSSLSNNTFFETKSASSVQINNLSFFSVTLINTLILLASRLA